MTFSTKALNEAVLEISSSVKKDQKSLTLASIGAEFTTDAVQCVETDDGDGERFSKGLTLFMDRTVELATLASLRLGTDLDVEDVKIAFKSLPEQWSQLLNVLFAEVRDPINAAGLEQTLTLEKLKAGEVETRDGEESWSKEKKARVKVARERNAMLTEVAKLCFASMLRATRDILTMAEALKNGMKGSKEETWCSSEICHQLRAIIRVVAVISTRRPSMFVRANELETASQAEATRWLLHVSRNSSSSSSNSCDHDKDYQCFSFHKKGREGGEGEEAGFGMSHEITAAPYLRCCYLSQCCCKDDGDDGGLEEEALGALSALQTVMGGLLEEEKEEKKEMVYVQLAKLES